jgi:signal peptidase II
MLIIIFRMYRRTPQHDAAQAVALALIAGGALGNLIDRLRSIRGVVDFIDVGIGDWRFWTFNVADMGVTTGAALLALLLIRRPAESPDEG